MKKGFRPTIEPDFDATHNHTYPDHSKLFDDRTKIPNLVGLTLEEANQEIKKINSGFTVSQNHPHCDLGGLNVEVEDNIITKIVRWDC